MVNISTLQSIYNDAKMKKIRGRYITKKDVNDALSYLNLNKKTIGRSVNNIPIDLYKFGKGDTKILMWSQMHGNETTTTKTVLDLISFFQQKNKFSQAILEHCELYIIPILNPDGAEAYTRENANNIDLNRDAQNRSQPESKALRSVFDTIKPHFCFNLHGQRTIFSAGNKPFSATLSFLASAVDENKTLTPARKKAMEIVVTINKTLQKIIPNQIGRYDDAFNLNCVGETFQTATVPTILFEAGHIGDDYQREKTREYVFYALLTTLSHITENEVIGSNFEDYFTIPENKKLFFDVLLKNVNIKENEVVKKQDIGILYKEILNKNTIKFAPFIEKIGDLNAYFGHETLDLETEQQNITINTYLSEVALTKILHTLTIKTP